jgi:hypothetical protein
MNTRLLLGALVGVTAIVALPSAANAAATCTYDQAKREMTVRYGANDTNVTVSNNAEIKYSESGGFLRSCFSTSGVSAKPSNTDKILIKAFSSTTAPLKQTTTLDERTGGRFNDSNKNLQIFVLTGTGGDRLTLRQGGLLDPTHLLNGSFGPAIDLGYDGDVDVRMTTSNDAIVQVDAGGGADFIDATGVTGYRTVQNGEAGNDFMIGSNRTDSFFGGPDNDTILSKDGVIENVDGGTGTDDNGTFDFSLDRLTGIERPGF